MKIIILTDKPAAWFSFHLPHINFRTVLFIITPNTCVSIKMYKVTESLPSLLVFVTASPSLRYPPFVYTQAKHICKLLYTTHRPSLQNQFLSLKKKINKRAWWGLWLASNQNIVFP